MSEMIQGGENANYAEAALPAQRKSMRYGLGLFLFGLAMGLGLSNIAFFYAHRLITGIVLAGISGILLEITTERIAMAIQRAANFVIRKVQIPKI